MQAARTLEEMILDSVQEGFRLNAVKLPTLPEVTLRVRQVAADPEAGVEELAAEIVRDAALTARLIRIANSPMLRGRIEVRTLPQAVTRLGFYYVRDLATALAMEHTFEPKCDVARQLMKRIARRSREIAALSHVLARHCTALPPEQALLAGLMHYVGALPLVVALHEHDGGSADADELFNLIERRHSGIGSTLLRHWRFPEDIACVPAAYRDAGREGAGDPDYADVVTVADMLCQPRERVPDLGAVAAAQRLGLRSADEFYTNDAMQIDLQRSAGLLN
ncbi:MAG TPA: HDOD domain-containing protein [Nevskia sp.]|jgi:HD-like signal output (HDOD) protein|nr:HDOD domain-containing protein [Nevskia sp.]